MAPNVEDLAPSRAPTRTAQYDTSDAFYDVVDVREVRNSFSPAKKGSVSPARTSFGKHEWVISGRPQDP